MGYGVNKVAYEGASRFISWSNGRHSFKTIINPTFKCSQSNDLYTVNGTNKGNEALTYPIGLITADEVGYAGGIMLDGNTSYYLYTGQNYWTMTPCRMYVTGTAGMFQVSMSISWTNLYNAWGIRPVINLKADTQLTGDGTETNPFKVAETA